MPAASAAIGLTRSKVLRISSLYASIFLSMLLLPISFLPSFLPSLLLSPRRRGQLLRFSGGRRDRGSIRKVELQLCCCCCWGLLLLLQAVGRRLYFKTPNTNTIILLVRGIKTTNWLARNNWRQTLIDMTRRYSNNSYFCTCCCCDWHAYY